MVAVTHSNQSATGPVDMRSGSDSVFLMVGRNVAVAEVGSAHYPVTRVFAFAAWLGVHAVLLTTVRAKMEAFFEWAWDYFGSFHVSPVMDRTNVDWAPEKPSTP